MNKKIICLNGKPLTIDGKIIVVNTNPSTTALVEDNVVILTNAYIDEDVLMLKGCTVENNTLILGGN